MPSNTSTAENTGKKMILTKQQLKQNTMDDVRLFDSESQNITETEDDIVETDRSLQRQTEDDICIEQNYHKNRKPPAKAQFGRNSLALPRNGSGGSVNPAQIRLEMNDRNGSNGSLKRNDMLAKSVGVSGAGGLMQVFRNSLTPGRTNVLSPRNRVAP